MYLDALPTRVRVLILGGGIHGVGLLHDMATRGWKDIHLVEKLSLGSTRSFDYEMIHGGFSYLKKLNDLVLIRDAIREQRLLLSLLPDVIKPIEIILPLEKDAGKSQVFIKTRLTLYDVISGRYKIQPHRCLNLSEIYDKLPILDKNPISGAYSYWDALVDVEGLIKRAALSAKMLSAGISEQTEVLHIKPSEDGWDVYVKNYQGETKIISALYVVNALGVSANDLLEYSGIKPTHRIIKRQAVQLALPDLSLKAGLLLQSKLFRRSLIVLPIPGSTMIAQTQDQLINTAHDVEALDQAIKQVMEECKKLLSKNIEKNLILRKSMRFSSLAVETRHGFSDASRVSLIGERGNKRGLLFTLYGGNLTSYRTSAETIGDRITGHFGEFRKCQTNDIRYWASTSDPEN